MLTSSAANGNVEPNGNITRAEVATIFFRLLTEKVHRKFHPSPTACPM